jgi:hypothetical protein
MNHVLTTPPHLRTALAHSAEDCVRQLVDFVPAAVGPAA